MNDLNNLTKQALKKLKDEKNHPNLIVLRAPGDISYRSLSEPETSDDIEELLRRLLCLSNMLGCTVSMGDIQHWSRLDVIQMHSLINDRKKELYYKI